MNFFIPFGKVFRRFLEGIIEMGGRYVTSVEVVTGMKGATPEVENSSQGTSSGIAVLLIVIW